MNAHPFNDEQPDGIYHVLTASRSFSNECKGAGRVACVAQDGAVICYTDSVEEAVTIAAELQRRDEPTKHESTTQPGLFYWAEQAHHNVSTGAVTSYAVIAQAEGYPASEAHDDYFRKIEDADAVAQALARGEDLY